MSRRVYGGLFVRGTEFVRGVMCGTIAQIAAATNQSEDHIRKTWAVVTKNEKEISLATSKPGILFWAERGQGKEYKEL